VQGLMQQHPLTLDSVVRRAETMFAGKRVGEATPGGVVWTDYGTWASRTRRLGSALDRLGLSADARVGTFAWNTSRHLELYFAVPGTGRVLHTLNVRLFPDQLTYIVNHAGDEAVFVDRSVLRRIWPLIDQWKSVRHVIVMDDTGPDGPEIPADGRILDYEELLAGVEPHAFDVVTDENTAASMCYTSGTTGDPKGVVYSHRSLVLHTMAVLMADCLGVSEDDVALPLVPMFHANAAGMVHGAVMAGADLLLPGADLSAEAVTELITRENVTVAIGVPTLWIGCLAALSGKQHSLRLIHSGGSPVSRALSESYREQVGLPIQQGWGMTETSPQALISRVRRNTGAASGDDLAELRAAQGRPLPNIELRIVDPESLQTQPWDASSVGELQVRGPWVARAYYNDARGAEAFTPDGWLRTGDAGTVSPQGSLRLVDRMKDLIKSGGEWISSVELENHLMAHEAIAEAAVIAIPSERWVERPMACVVLKPGTAVTGDEVIDWLRPRVAKWWLPDEVAFIDEIPKTSTGKFWKKHLRDTFAHVSVP
jgi:fatty-acyl-CoA synthase